MTAPIWAMSFACWKCIDCRQVVAWVDAVPVDTDEEYGVRHKECPK